MISLGRVTTLLLLSRAAGYLLALGSSVALARALGVDRLGEYAYAMGLAALFGLLPNMGISTLLTRSIAQDAGTGAGMIRATLRAQALLAVGVPILILAFAAVLPGQPVPLRYVGLAAAQLGLGSMSWPYLAVVSGRGRYDRLAAAEMATGIVGTITLIGAAVVYGNVTAVLVAHVLGAGAALWIARSVAAPFLPTQEGHSIRAFHLIRQGVPFGAIAAVQSLYTRLDVLLLGQLSSTAALGLYNVAYKPINLAVYFGGTMAGPLFPLMAQSRERGAPVAFSRAMRGLGVAAPAMALAVSGLANPLLRVLYGMEFTPAAPILVVLAWSAAVNWLYAPLGVALQARGQERWWLSILVGGLVVNTGANLWAIPRWGAVGAATATLASEIALLGLGALLVARKLDILPSLRPLLVGLGATAVGGGVLWGLHASGAVPSTVAALILYCGLLICFRIVTVEDATTVWRWMRQAPVESRG